ncbi:DNA-binding protein [Bacillus sp. CMF12]|uniref:DNA-binding protein n=1 Tax=Bacillus sp. CMF12 TaxID=2884834 RepID=UPI002079D7AD|nr:DNA-binding protein [Bacillus sp. CMF12]USK48848.1 DNA-binding protein [Bacillus sp. CMF12]
MKKLLIAGVAMLFLSACTQEESEPVVNDTETNTEVSSKEEEPSQEELNAKLKDEAVQANFVELNVDNPPDGKKVFAEGEVSTLIKDDVLDEFTITTNEGNGHGMYSVNLINTTEFEYKEGDRVRIYGAVKGKDEGGLPQISATIIEGAK